MASLARLEFTVQDSSGTALAGVSVAVRKQGAQVFGNQSNVNVVTVDSPGGIVAGDQVNYNSGSTPTRSVVAVTATTVQIGGPGDSFTDDDRISDITLPTVYEDEIGNTSRTNPLITDANGFASCYVVGGKYDILFSGGGVTTMLRQDMVAVGGETTQSNIVSGVAFVLDTLRTIAAGNKLLSVRNATVEKFSISDSGGFTASDLGTISAGGLNVTDGLTVATGGLAVSASGATVVGPISGSTTITAGTGLVATSGGVTATGTSTLTGALTGVTTLTRQRAAQSSVPTLTVNSTTPSVSAGTVFAENNTVPTSITNFTSGGEGQLIHIIFNTANTTLVDGVTIQLAGGANFVSTANDVVTLVSWLGTWYEVCRSVN